MCYTDWKEYYIYILHNKKDSQNNFKSVTVPKSMDRGLTWPKVSGMRRGEGSLFTCTTGKIQIDTGRKRQKRNRSWWFQAQECEEVWAAMYNGDGRNLIPKAHHEYMLNVRKISCKYPWGLAWRGNMRQFLPMFIWKKMSIVNYKLNCY